MWKNAGAGIQILKSVEISLGVGKSLGGSVYMLDNTATLEGMPLSCCSSKYLNRGTRGCPTPITLNTLNCPNPRLEDSSRNFWGQVFGRK